MKELTIKTRVINAMETGRIYTRREIETIYNQVRGFYRWNNHLSTALCRPAGTEGYFCRPSKIERRYIKRIGQNQYVVETTNFVVR